MRFWRLLKVPWLLVPLVAVVLVVFTPLQTLARRAGKTRRPEQTRLLKIRRIDGWIGAGYKSDKEQTKRTQKDSGSDITIDEEEFFEELDLGGTVSIYHPRFILIDGHVLVRIEQGNRDVNYIGAEEGDRDQELNEYDVKATFLSEHPYNVTIFGRRNINDIEADFFPDYDVTNEQLGATFRWWNKVAPMSLRVMQTEEDRTGINPEDEDTVSVEYNAERKTDRLWSSFEYDWEDEEEVSSSFRRELQTQRANLRNSLFFGEDRRSSFTNNLIYDEQKKSVDRKEFDGLVNLRLQHSPNFQTHYDYRGRWMETELQTTVLHDGELGFMHRLYRNLTTTFDAGGSFEDQDTGEILEPRTRLEFDYIRSIPYGSVTLATQVGFEYRDEDFTTPIGQVLDESHTFSSSSIVRLNNEFVNLATIVITGAGCLTVCVEGIDYSTQLNGNFTEIVRLLGGDINIGDTIEVDYEFERPRSRRFYTIDRGFRFGVNLFQSFRPFVSFRRFDRHLLDGVEPGGEDDVIDWIGGMSFSRWGLYFSAEHEEYDSELFPRNTNRVNAGYNLRLPYRSVFSISGAWFRSEFPNDTFRASLDPNIRDFTEVVNYNVRLMSNPFRFLTLEGGVRFRDEDGRIENEEMVMYGLVRLSIRQIEITIKAERRDEEDRGGEAFSSLEERDRDLFEAEIKRRF